ncbi:MAG: DUF1838 domain-containing protein [Steroidobacteraceae bacterium]|jgi:hypothetical protein|nr:DUF1838 domain-containing protein [Steroidobacteraceae bacterium]
MRELTRRDALTAAAGLAALGAGSQASAATTGRRSTASAPDFTDPLVAHRTHVKVVGSLGREVVHSFMRLNLYADLGSGNFVPLFTMNNILVDYWEPKEDDAHEMRKYEVGFYTKFDGYEPLEHFDNPVTGQRVPIHHFRLGPVPRVYTPGGVIAMGFNPRLLPIETLGERVFVATQSIENSPDMVRPGQTNYVNSFMTMSAALADVADPKVLSAPAHLQLQNKNRWQAWMGMGERPGGTVARGFGTKIRDLEALPAAVREGARRFVPEIFDTKNWTEFVFEDSEYLKQRK